jgi:hypothetical protein
MMCFTDCYEYLFTANAKIFVHLFLNELYHSLLKEGLVGSAAVLDSVANWNFARKAGPRYHFPLN